MALSISNDPSRPAGGHAILDGPDLAGVVALALENVYSGLFLSADGRWAKLPHAFAVEPVPGAPPGLRLGPAIVDNVPAELQLALSDGDGRPLGRLFWIDIVPSRSRTAPAPAAVPPLPEPPPPPAPPPPPLGTVAPAVPAPVSPPVPAGRRGSRRGLIAAGLLAAACGVAAFALWPHPPAPKPTPAPLVRDCSGTFAGRLATARRGSDDERVKLAEEALAARCGAQAFAALDGTDWEVSEPAAWYLARFYDPDETDPAFRAAALPHADWAAAYYARWAARAPRQAEALKRLCDTQGAALGENAQIKRACGR